MKKAYTLLPAHERKTYYAVKEAPTLHKGDDDHKAQTLVTFWSKLMNVTQLNFDAKSQSKDDAGWNGKGKGQVFITKHENTLLFTEKGSWRNKQDKEMSFSNVFRWTFDQDAGFISLEHLRRGPDQPVELFRLAPSGKQSLSSLDSHLCDGDIYFGHLHFDRYTLRLNWRIIGPKKNEEIDYFYS